MIVDVVRSGVNDAAEQSEVIADAVRFEAIDDVVLSEVIAAVEQLAAAKQGSNH